MNNTQRTTDYDIFIKLLKMQLASYRKLAGLTQVQLAELSGLSTSCISNMETGDGSFTIDSLAKYATALGIDINISINENTEKDTKVSKK